MTFVEMVEAGVKASGKSAAAVGRELGLAPITMSRLKRGEIAMGEENLRRFAAVTGLDPDELVIASGACFQPGGIRARVSALMRENQVLKAENQRLKQLTVDNGQLTAKKEGVAS